MMAALICFNSDGLGAKSLISTITQTDKSDRFAVSHWEKHVYYNKLYGGSILSILSISR